MGLPRPNTILLLAALFVGPVASAQFTSLEGELWKAPVEGVFGVSPNGKRVRARVGEWFGEGRRVGRSYLVSLRKGVNSVGLAGRLEGKENAPVSTLYLLVKRSAQGQLTASVYRGGWKVGSLRSIEGPPRAAGLDPLSDPDGEADERKLKRDAWWARHAVAGWGVARAFWDFYKPGGKKLEELRGPVTRNQTQRLRDELDGVAEPWGPADIFGAARAISRGDREALQLCFAFVVDERDLPIRQLTGIALHVPIHDKYEHFFASAVMAHRSNARGSFTVGWMKEVLDEVAGSGYDEDDLMADALGADFGQALHLGEIRDH